MLSKEISERPVQGSAQALPGAYRQTKGGSSQQKGLKGFKCLKTLKTPKGGAVMLPLEPIVVVWCRPALGFGVLSTCDHGGKGTLGRLGSSLSEAPTVEAVET